mgnify:CR=1 FL=1
MFGINGKLYNMLIEVEPPNVDDNVAVQDPPTASTQVSMETEKGNDLSAEEVGSHKSFKNSSETGSVTSATSRNSSHSLCQNDIEPPTPTSLLKSQVLESLRNNRARALYLLLGNDGEIPDGCG